MTATHCPFLPLTERDLEGPSLDDEEQQGLHDHLERGCPECEACIEMHLSGSGEGDAAEGVRRVNGELERAVEYAAVEMDRGRALVLGQIQRRIAEEDRTQRRLVRRRMQRVLFYMVSISTVFLLAAVYVSTHLTAKLARINAERLATETEVTGLSRALARYVQDHRRLPASMPELLEALQSPRPASHGQPYYPLDRARLKDGGYRDVFGKPYRSYRYLVRADRALIYSVGPDRKDDEGEGDDITDRAGWVTFVPR